MQTKKTNRWNESVAVKRAFIAASVASAAISLYSRAALADNYQWASPTTGNWSAGANWADLTNPSQSGMTPLSDPGLQLTFNGGLSNYTATNDVSPYALNSLTFSGNGSNGTTATVNGLASNGIVFQGGSPTLSLSGSSSATVGMSITYASGMLITNTGTGLLTLGAGSGYTQSEADGMIVTNAGLGSINFVDGGTYNSYGGGPITVHLVNDNAATHSFGIANESGIVGTIDIDAGTVYSSGSATGNLFGNSAVLNVAAGATFDFKRQC